MRRGWGKLEPNSDSDEYNCEIALLCQKKDSYTNSVYSKDTLGTLLTISQRFNFSEFPFTDLIF